MERERQVWNEHKDLLLAGERSKCDEENVRLLQNLQSQLKSEQERGRSLEQKLYDAQMVRCSSRRFCYGSRVAHTGVALREGQKRSLHPADEMYPLMVCLVVASEERRVDAARKWP